MSFQLDPACPPGADLVRVIGNRLAEAIIKICDQRRPTKERIHAARTSSKQLRAAFKLLRTRERKRYRQENRVLADAARELSVLREADAMLDAFDAVVKHYATPRKKFAAVRVALLRERGAVRATGADVEHSFRRFVSRLRQVQQRLEGWKPDADFRAIAADFGRTYQRARRSFQALKIERSPDAFHEWRKPAKAYAYQCRLLRAAWPAPMKELGAELNELSTLLGDEHDLTLLRARLRMLIRMAKLSLEDEKAAELLGLIVSRRDELRDEAMSLGERLFVDKRRAVEVRILRWWSVRPRPTKKPQ
jgi:CHAD domain-containing protein